MDNKLRWKLALAVLLIPAIAFGIYWFLRPNWDLTKGPFSPANVKPAAFQALPLGSIKPKGWLLEQMKAQAGGLTGHLDEFWPDIKDSGWVGGPGDGWERAPYWLDGLVPLAYELDDPKLKAKANKWMDYILTHQNPNGWLGEEQSPASYQSNAPPPNPRDPWPQFIILKCLTQYQEATGDPRVIPAMQREMKSLNAQLDQQPLYDWNFFRWCDLEVSVLWLYDRTEEPWLLELAEKVAYQGYNWPKHFSDLPLKVRSPRWNWVGHVVNNAMGLKTPALLYRLTGENRYRDLAPKALLEMDRYHGEANGLFSGDECLAGRNPSQGTELCAIVETMFSLEMSLGALGNVTFGDRLEKVAFNALPAAFTTDYWCHQYDEQSNQIACGYIREPIYTTNRGEANVFGLEPQYGCCTSNMHQGWPKFTSHLWMGTPDGGLAVVAYAPSVLETSISKTKVQVELVTDYPFSEELVFKVVVSQPVDFPLYFRVPEWAQNATVQLPDGSSQSLKAGTFEKVQRKWTGNETLTLRLPMTFHLAKGFNDSMSVERGPLVYSLGIKAEWHNFMPFRYQPKGEKRYDQAALPLTQWSYGLVLDSNHPGNSLTFQGGTIKGNPFTLEGAPNKVQVKGKVLQDWGIEKGAAMPPPQSPVTSSSSEEELTLVPYGSTRLRITEFPVLK